MVRASRRVFLILVALWLALAGPAAAEQPLSGLATVSGAGLSLAERRGRVLATLELSQPVPWRVFTLDDPWRVVLDFSEVDWSGVEVPAAQDNTRIEEIATGVFRPGWSRMVIALARPMAVDKAGMETTADGARISLRLVDTDAQSFAARAGAPASAVFTKVEQAIAVAAAGGGAGVLTAQVDDRFVVVLDPGHGGIDPGAEREGVREADVMLTFARELREVLRRAGDVEVVLTRDDDVFVPLEERVTIARRAGADVFISLHADALAEGRASGATVYTLAADATDEASERLAERHDRADLLAGVDFSETEDEVALVLMDIARTETQPRADRLADALVEGIFDATGSTYKTPRMQADFSVLKAPDIPSVLVELGFISSPADREKLVDPEWRARAAAGLSSGVLKWADEDAAVAERLRK